MPQLNWKRILLILGFIAAVIILGYLLYYFFFKPALPPGPPVNVNVPIGVLPNVGVNVNVPIANINAILPPSPPPAVAPPSPISEVATGGVTQTLPLTATPTYGATLAADGSNLLYYDKNVGKFYQLTPDGQSRLLSDQTFYQVEKITWAPDKAKAVLEYPDGANIVYDFETKSQVTLPKHWKDFDFSPNSDQLVFKSMGINEENRWLAVSSADGSQARKIEHLGNKDATVHPLWSPNGQIIAVYREDLDFDRQNLYFVGLHNENFKLTILDGRGFRGQWSPTGKQLLYSVYNSSNDYKPTLWIVDAEGENIGQNRRSLKLETWADKCSFASGDVIYCAVPQKLEGMAGIFATEMDNYPCDIYKIDLKTGFKTMIAQPEGEHNIGRVIVSNDGRYLYFTSKDDGRLYKIRLK